MAKSTDRSKGSTSLKSHFQKMPHPLRWLAMFIPEGISDVIIQEAWQFLKGRFLQVHPFPDSTHQSSYIDSLSKLEEEDFRHFVQFEKRLGYTQRKHLVIGMSRGTTTKDFDPGQRLLEDVLTFYACDQNGQLTDDAFKAMCEAAHTSFGMKVREDQYLWSRIRNWLGIHAGTQGNELLHLIRHLRPSPAILAKIRIYRRWILCSIAFLAGIILVIILLGGHFTATKLDQWIYFLFHPKLSGTHDFVKYAVIIGLIILILGHLLKRLRQFIGPIVALTAIGLFQADFHRQIISWTLLWGMVLYWLYAVISHTRRSTPSGLPATMLLVALAFHQFPSLRYPADNALNRAQLFMEGIHEQTAITGLEYGTATRPTIAYPCPDCRADAPGGRPSHGRVQTQEVSIPAGTVVHWVHENEQPILDKRRGEPYVLVLLSTASADKKNPDDFNPKERLVVKRRDFVWGSSAQENVPESPKREMMVGFVPPTPVQVPMVPIYIPEKSLPEPTVVTITIPANVQSMHIPGTEPSGNNPPPYKMFYIKGGEGYTCPDVLQRIFGQPIAVAYDGKIRGSGQTIAATDPNIAGAIKALRLTAANFPKPEDPIGSILRDTNDSQGGFSVIRNEPDPSINNNDPGQSTTLKIELVP